MGKEAYLAAFEILKTQNNMCNTLEDIGLHFEYGTGPIGIALEELINKSFTIVKDTLGIQINPQTRKININGHVQTAQFDVFFIGDYDENFTITEDDFSEFVFYAIHSRKLQDWFWRAMVEKDEEARTLFNGVTKNFQIGNYWKGNK